MPIAATVTAAMAAIGFMLWSIVSVASVTTKVEIKITTVPIAKFLLLKPILTCYACLRLVLAFF